MIYEISTKDFANLTDSYDIVAVKDNTVYIESTKKLGSPAKKSKLPDDVVERQTLEFENQKSELCQKINSNRTIANSNSIEYNGTKFQATEADQTLISSTLVSFPDALPVGFVWIAEDNTQVPVTREDLQNIAQLIAANVAQNYLKARVLKDTVLAAENTETLNQLDVDTPFGISKPHGQNQN